MSATQEVKSRSDTTSEPDHGHPLIAVCSHLTMHGADHAHLTRCCNIGVAGRSQEKAPNPPHGELAVEDVLLLDVTLAVA